MRFRALCSMRSLSSSVNASMACLISPGVAGSGFRGASEGFGLVFIRSTAFIFRALLINAQIVRIRDKEKVRAYCRASRNSEHRPLWANKTSQQRRPKLKRPSASAWQERVPTMTPGNENRNEKLVIFVNGKKKTSEEDGVTNPMSVDAIARLAGLTADTAVVRRRQGEDGPVGDPLTGQVPIKNGEHFVVTRKNVEG